MKKRPADPPHTTHLSPKFTSPFLHLAQERGEVRSYPGERVEGVGGGVEGASSVAHRAEVCSLAHYKTLVKRGRGGAGGQVVRGAFGGGGLGWGEGVLGANLLEGK